MRKLRKDYDPEDLRLWDAAQYRELYRKMFPEPDNPEEVGPLFPDQVDPARLRRKPARSKSDERSGRMGNQRQGEGAR